MGYFDYVHLKLLEPGVYPLAGTQGVVLDIWDLARMADDYNKLKPSRLAPIVIGHPEGDAPQYGLIESLSERDNSLMALANITSESFRQLWKKGEYERHEALFFAPDNPTNPKPGSKVPMMRGIFVSRGA